MSLSPALPVLVSHRGVGVSDSVGVVSGRTVSGAATFNSHWEQFQVREAHCLTLLYCTLLYCTVLYVTVLYCTVLYCTVLYCSLEKGIPPFYSPI